MTSAQEYPVPEKWRPPGPGAPADIQEVVSWIRDVLANHGLSGDGGASGYILSPVDSVGKHSSIYRLKSDLAEYCVKVYSEDWIVRASREWVGLRVLHEFGVLGAPRAYALSISPEATFIVREWLSGSSLGECYLTRRQLEALSELVKVVHSITPAGVGEPLWSCFWNPERRLDEFPSEIESLRSNPKEQALEAASLAQVWLKTEDPQILLEFEASVFSRGDPNLANCLWDDGKLCFVDLESSGWRDPIIDLALITEHIQARRTPHDEWRWFIDLFHLTKRQHKRLIAAQRQLALSWLIVACNEPRRVHSLPETERFDILLDRVRFVCGQNS